MMTVPANANLSDGRRRERLSLARLIVCERDGRWAVGLRRELAASGVRLYETRSLPESWAMLADWPASLLVVEVTRVNAEALLRRMGSLGLDFPLARVAMVAERGLAPYEWLLRETGAVHFAATPRQLGMLADLAVRHLAAAPQRDFSLTDRIWASLPWGT